MSGRREALGESHQAQRLAIALGLRHAVVAPHALLGVAALLVADEHDRRARRAARGRRRWRGRRAYMRSPCSSWKSVKIEPDVVERVGPLRMARELRDLPGRQIREDAAASAARSWPAAARSLRWMLSSESSRGTCFSSSIFASSSAIGCSKSRKFTAIGPRAYRHRRYKCAQVTSAPREPRQRQAAGCRAPRSRPRPSSGRPRSLDRALGVGRTVHSAPRASVPRRLGADGTARRPGSAPPRCCAQRLPAACASRRAVAAAGGPAEHDAARFLLAQPSRVG